MNLKFNSFRQNRPAARKKQGKKPKINSKKPLLATLVLAVAITGGIAVYKSFTTESATFGWIQTDWSGGNTENTATHETDQTGWTEFANKDDNLDTSTPGEISAEGTVETATRTTTEDFEESTLDNLVAGSDEISPSGGVVVTDDFNGRTLIAQETDISDDAEWGCKGTSISGADSSTDGAQNTQDILDGCSDSGIAARLCDESTEGGFDDWYLPAKDELDVLYQNKDDVGGFSSDSYWSSSEYSSDHAWRQYFDNGNQYYYSKNNSYRVRCIRSLQN